MTELAGRGVGMDVVRSEVDRDGRPHRDRDRRRPGHVVQAGPAADHRGDAGGDAALRRATRRACRRRWSRSCAAPRRAKSTHAYASGAYEFGDRALPFFWLGALLQARPRSRPSRRRATRTGRRRPQRRSSAIAVHVDEVLGNQEVVVKNLGPQLSRLPGLAGMTLLASGAVALIYNPVALATLYGDAGARGQRRRRRDRAAAPPAPARDGAAAPAGGAAGAGGRRFAHRAPRHAAPAACARATAWRSPRTASMRSSGWPRKCPQVVLSDIEMPRMDGFDLVRNIRADARWRDLPVIMITSRIAQKHRDHATELGVDHYLGKPYSEEDLLALIARYTAAAAEA